jgi:hypothetical protein
MDSDGIRAVEVRYVRLQDTTYLGTLGPWKSGNPRYEPSTLLLVTQAGTDI